MARSDLFNSHDHLISFCFFHTYLCQSDVIGTQSTFQSDWNLDEKKMIHHLKIIKCPLQLQKRSRMGTNSNNE